MRANATGDEFADKVPEDFARSGPIGLQGLQEQAPCPVYDRNLKIKPLD